MGIATPFRARFGIQARVVNYPDSATITPDANTSDICVVALSQAVLFANPIAANPYDGQLLQIRISSLVSRAISFGTAYQGASSLGLPQFTTGGDKEDYIAFRYNSTDLKYDLIGTTIGVTTASTGISAADAIAYSIAFGGM